MKNVYAENYKQDGYVTYQLPAINLNGHKYFGWKMVKQKTENYIDGEEKSRQRQVDDDTAAVIYDDQTTATMANANLLKLAANQQLVNAQLLKEIAVLKGATK